MLTSEISACAEEMLDLYRQVLLVDPFIKISVEIVDGDFVSVCQPDTGALSWKISLNPSRHHDIDDVKYSVLDGVVRVGFADLDRIGAENQHYAGARDAVVARLTTALCSLLVNNVEEDNQNEAEDLEGE